MNQLFPKEIIDHSQEKNFFRHSLSTRIIYLVTAGFIIIAIALVPLIRVDVGVHSQGLIRPVIDIIPIQSPVSGYLQSLNTKENSSISRGELFARISSPELNEQIRFNKTNRQKLNKFLADLNSLLQADSAAINSPMSFHSAVFQQSYLEFRQQLANKKQLVKRLESLYHKKKLLYERNAESEAAREEALFNWKDAVGQYRFLVEQQKNRWKQEMVSFQNELHELESEYERLQQEQKRYDIRSPVTGTVQNIAGIYDNSFVYHNQVLGEISPDTLLVAEIYVSPRDIGLIDEGMPVRMQIDAYNYNQWGIATGEVLSISRDIWVNEEQSGFKVKCSIDQSYLQLSNGVTGNLKKGMTLQARFILSRRSLFQLLYDKMDDWLNPNWDNSEVTILEHN